jgi:hypothetical protein
MTAEARSMPAPPSGLVVSTATFLAVACLIVAAALRLPELDWLPLDAREGAIALRAAGGGSLVPLPAGVAPLLVQLERLMFWLLGTTDTAARLGPALAGVAMVAVAAALRGPLGRAAAVGTAAVIALSPAWTALSRTAGPGTLAALGSLLVLWAVWSERPRLWPALAAAVVLCSGAAGLTFVAAAALAVAIVGLAPARAWLAAQWPGAPERRTALLVAAAAVGVLATGLLTQPQGFQLLVETPASFFARLTPDAGCAEGPIGCPGGGPGTYWLALLAYAPFELAFGLAGLFLAYRRSAPFGAFLLLWVALAALTGTLADDPWALAEILPPLSLAAGLALAALAEALLASFRWGEEGVMAGILLTVGGFAVVQAWRLADTPLVETGLQDDVAFQLLIGALAMVVLLTLVYIGLWGRPAAARTVGLAALAFLPVLGWANGSHAAYGAATALREPLRPIYVAPDARGLVATIEQYSWIQTKDPHAVAVRADPATAPFLAWSLQAFGPRVAWARGTGEITEPVVVRPAGATDAFGPRPYVGSRYALSGTWRPNFERSDGATNGAIRARNFARWYLQRRSPGATPWEGVNLGWAELFVLGE